MPLRERTEEFIENGPLAGFGELLDDCIRDRSTEAMACVSRLFASDYGGFTFKYELKEPAARALLNWGERGLAELVEVTARDQRTTNVSIATSVLAKIAAGLPDPFAMRLRGAEQFVRASEDAVIVEAARMHLIELVQRLDEEDIAFLASNAMQGLSFVDNSGRTARELFAALSTRWLAISRPTLDKFDGLISQSPNDESVFQRFFIEHPQMLDPMAAQMWPEPDLLGARRPDFIIRRADGTYLVIEIECPSKSIVTAGGQLSSHVTHAEQQAADYRQYLIRHFSEAALHFPDFQEPDCLVVIGLERPLSGPQQQALRDANRGRHHLRIVGFDWLAQRARTVAQNITRHRIEVSKARVA